MQGPEISRRLSLQDLVTHSREGEGWTLNPQGSNDPVHDKKSSKRVHLAKLMRCLGCVGSIVPMGFPDLELLVS